jgi:uncharacterized protein YodC (DUF2158 family)
MNKYKEFETGDKVKTKSGCIVMAVVRIIGSEKQDEFVFVAGRGYEIGDIICEWSDGNGNRKTDIFRKSSVELIVEKDS